MKIVYLTKGSYTEILDAAESVIVSGGVIALPTDTVYGMVGDALQHAAVQKMHQLKHRPRKKVLPIFVRDIAMARTYAYINDTKAKFLERVWPGPVTVIFHRKDKFPKIVSAGADTVAMRMPDNQLILDLIEKLGRPLAQTSANISGYPPAHSVEEIKNYFSDGNLELDLMVDGGEIVGKPSTIIDFTRQTPLVLRAGLFTKDEFETIIRNFSSTVI